MSDDTRPIEELLQVPGCNCKYDLRTYANGEVFLYEEYTGAHALSGSLHAVAIIVRRQIDEINSRTAQPQLVDETPGAP